MSSVFFIYTAVPNHYTIEVPGLFYHNILGILHTHLCLDTERLLLKNLVLFFHTSFCMFRNVSDLFDQNFRTSYFILLISLFSTIILLVCLLLQPHKNVLPLLMDYPSLTHSQICLNTENRKPCFHNSSIL